MTSDLDLRNYAALSFDCYGTLIDWEAGLSAVLEPWAREQGLDLTAEQLLLTYGDNEAEVQSESPTALYPDVLATAFRRTADRFDRPVSDEWATRLGGSVPDWPPFPDSADALARLARHYRLIILSNVHREGFAAATSTCAVTSPPSLPPRTLAPTSRPRTTSVPWTRRCPSSEWPAPSCSTSPRACSTTTSRPSARVCLRCGSTGVTTATAGAPPPSRPARGPTTSNSRPWATSRTPSTKPSPPTPRADQAEANQGSRRS